MRRIYKYPRTHHIEGSRLQPGDEDLDCVPFSEISGRHLIVEEKMDGANSAISFSPEGELYLQSRGHYLTGGPREKHFTLFKQWANTHAHTLRDRLGERYIMYGEWLYAKHTVFYDTLPHYFMEFDILDTEAMEFLSTHARRELLADLPVVSVPVLHEGPLKHVNELTAMVGPSKHRTSENVSRLGEEAQRHGMDPDRVFSETDCSGLMEGLYIKVEEDGVVRERFKWVRADFLNAVDSSGSHWLNRPILPNLLHDEVDLFS